MVLNIIKGIEEKYCLFMQVPYKIVENSFLSKHIKERICIEKRIIACK